MNRNLELRLVSSDVYIIIKEMKEIGWLSIRQVSINRILYFASILYSFIFPNKENIFEKNYHFKVTLRGPEISEVDNALINLECNEYIIHTEAGYAINNKKSNLEYIITEKQSWLENIAYIVGLYGEDKLYDFIFRDPEYRNSIAANKLYNLNIGTENDTIIFLNIFKGEFEKKLDKNIKFDNRKYLELYFEYVFGQILKGK